MPLLILLLALSRTSILYDDAVSPCILFFLYTVKGKKHVLNWTKALVLALDHGKKKVFYLSNASKNVNNTLTSLVPFTSLASRTAPFTHNIAVMELGHVFFLKVILATVHGKKRLFKMSCFIFQSGLSTITIGHSNIICLLHCASLPCHCHASISIMFLLWL